MPHLQDLVELGLELKVGLALDNETLEGFLQGLHLGLSLLT